MKKMLYYVIIVAVILAIGAVCIVFASDENDNIEFLKSFGWIVEESYIEREKVEIPETFDAVYNNYNDLQKLAGLDLVPYKGRSAIRYTYRVKNFPQDISDEVRANVLCVDNKAVAGDIMTVRLDGFMYSLDYLNIGK